MISDRGQLERLLAYLQWGGVVLSVFIIPAGGLATTLGRVIFSAAMAVSAAELAVSVAEGDDLGVVFAAAGIIFDSLEISALARNGLKAAAAGQTVGSGEIALDVVLDIADDIDLELGRTIALGRRVANPSDPLHAVDLEDVLDLTDTVAIDAANAVRASESGAVFEQGLAHALTSHVKSGNLASAVAGLSAEQSDELARAVVARHIDGLPEEAQDAYRALTAVLEVTSGDELIEFSDHLVTAMTKGWNHPELTPDELVALHRATVQNPTLDEAGVRAQYDLGLRWQPGSPGAWQRFSELDFRPTKPVALADGLPPAIPIGSLPAEYITQSSTLLSTRAALRRSGDNFSDVSRELGELLAEGGLAARYPDAPLRVIDIHQTGNRTGMFDAIYEVTTASGETRLVIVEAKGVATTGPSFPVRQIGGVNYQQGHREYFLDTLRQMRNRPEAAARAVDRAALDEIMVAVEDGTLDYLLVTAEHLNRPDDLLRVAFREFPLPMSDPEFLESMGESIGVAT